MHPAIEHVLKFFEYKHLPETLQPVSKPFCELAHRVAESAPDSQETTVALRKLLEAKDAAVRAVLTITVLLLLGAMAQAQTYQPRRQAVLYTGANCPPCPVLISDLKSLKGCEVAAKGSPHFILRPGKPGMSVPAIAYYDDDGKLFDSHVGYRSYRLPYEDRLTELRKIIRKHPMFRSDDKPPMAPPVEDVSIASRSAPVRTAELVMLGGDGTVQIPESQGADIQTIQYAPFASDCSGSQAQAFAMPYSDCSGGGVGGGGGDFDPFPPPAQSAYMMPQQYAQPYAQPYIAQYARPYTVAYAPRYSPYASPYAAGGGNVNNFSLLSVPMMNPNFSVFGLNGLFGQRAYYPPRRLQYRSIAPSYGGSLVAYGRVPYRTVAPSPFSFASYSRPVSYGSRMVCGPNGCVMY